jgi:RNA polymerase sigma-70 factor (ECF subfamily)
VLQDAMLKAWHCAAQYRGDAPFWAWLRRLVVNEALMRLRRDKAAGQPLELPGEDFLPDDVAPPPTAAADAVALQRALAALPPMTRSVLWLYHAEGYTHDEIAALMQRTTSFSKSQLARGSRRLRALLEPETRPEPTHA